jgi:hypothetical protein
MRVMIQWIVIGVGVLIALILLKKILKKPKGSKTVKFGK